MKTRKKNKSKSLIAAEKSMEDLLKKVGYKGTKQDSIHSIPDYRVSKTTTSDKIPTSGHLKEKPRYGGNEILGITLNHKSNYEPIRKDNKDAAVASAQMRRS